MSTHRDATSSRPSWLDRLPVVATILVAIAAGVLAADATHDVAVRSGAVGDPTLAWMLPLILEGGAVTAGLLAWRRARSVEGAGPERLALAVLILLAVVVNASHASTWTPLGVVLAATPPIVLVTGVELLLRSHKAGKVVSARVLAQPEREQNGDPTLAHVGEQAAPTPTEQASLERLSVSTEPPTEREH